MSHRARVLILGAGGRDFHVFNTCYRDDPATEVVAFTAAQIPHIAGRTYPPALAGPLYPAGIPIVPEDELETRIRRDGVEHAVFAYSDVPLAEVDAIAGRVRGCGASFSVFDFDRTMLRSAKPAVAVCAVRTGCGKSAVSRVVVRTLRGLGLRPAVLRHPMPYGNLAAQVVQRFASSADLAAHRCTIEEREEYEPHLAEGSVVFAGADYARILAAAERECDVVVWDGGNNDLPFVRPDLHVVLLDPLRPGHEVSYFPSLENLRRAHVLVLAKMDEARPEDVATVLANVREWNPRARVVEGRSPIRLDGAGAIRGKRVLVVEDGPTATHGGMGYGAGSLAATRAGAEVVDPRPFAAGEIARAYARWPHLRAVVPALGYGEQDVADLEATIDRTPCDAVVVGTPIDLARVVRIRKPCVRVTYGFEDSGRLAEMLREHFAAARPRPATRGSP